MRAGCQVGLGPGFFADCAGQGLVGVQRGLRPTHGRQQILRPLEQLDPVKCFRADPAVLVRRARLDDRDGDLVDRQPRIGERGPERVGPELLVLLHIDDAHAVLQVDDLQMAIGGVVDHGVGGAAGIEWRVERSEGEFLLDSFHVSGVSKKLLQDVIDVLLGRIDEFLVNLNLVFFRFLDRSEKRLRFIAIRRALQALLADLMARRPARGVDAFLVGRRSLRQGQRPRTRPITGGRGRRPRCVVSGAVVRHCLHPGSRCRSPRTAARSGRRYQRSGRCARSRRRAACRAQR